MLLKQLSFLAITLLSVSAFENRTGGPDADLIQFLKTWVRETEDVRINLRYSFKEVLKNATSIQQQYYAKLNQAKNESIAQVTDWIMKNCPKCEGEKLNETLDLCYYSDNHTQQHKLEFYIFMSCVNKEIFNFLQSEREIDYFLKQLNDTFLSHNSNHTSNSTKPFENIGRLSQFIKILTNQTVNQMRILSKLSGELILNPYEKNYSEQNKMFAKWCYLESPYGGDIDFSEFRDCIVKNTCHENEYSRYLDQRRKNYTDNYYNGYSSNNYNGYTNNYYTGYESSSTFRPTSYY